MSTLKKLPAFYPPTLRNGGNNLDVQQIKEEAKMELRASILDNVASLPASRLNEIFEDFEGAVKTRDIEYLACTIVNWAFGGKGYEYVGAVVNPLTPVITEDSDEETLQIWNEMWRWVDSE